MARGFVGERIAELSALHEAPPALKRQVFEAVCLEVRYDKVERRIEISATVSEAVAKAFENAKDLPKEVKQARPDDAPSISELLRVSFSINSRAASSQGADA